MSLVESNREHLQAVFMLRTSTWHSTGPELLFQHHSLMHTREVKRNFKACFACALENAWIKQNLFLIEIEKRLQTYHHIPRTLRQYSAGPQEEIRSLFLGWAGLNEGGWIHKAGQHTPNVCWLMGVIALSYSLHHIHKAHIDGEREEKVREEESQCQQQLSRLGTPLGLRQLASSFHSRNWLRLMQNCFGFWGWEKPGLSPQKPHPPGRDRPKSLKAEGLCDSLHEPPFKGTKHERALHVGKNKVWHVPKAKSQQARWEKADLAETGRNPPSPGLWVLHTFSHSTNLGCHQHCQSPSKTQVWG